MNQIINSPLENDMYKFSMGQAIHNQFPSDTVEWRFRFRNWRDLGKVTGDMVSEIRRQIDAYCGLRFSEEDLDYLRSIPWIKPAYVDFLRLWHPRREEILVNEDGVDDCGLRITTKGSWLNTSMYEVPLLAIVSEVYLYMRDPAGYNGIKAKALVEAAKIADESANDPIGTFSEFGMRRRFSAELQDHVVAMLTANREKSGFVGTSNVYLAKKYGIKPVGTMAHEFIMCVGQGHHEFNPAYSNKFMMEAWEKEYGIKNGIALTDTLGTALFLRDFDERHATLFSGVRHDSGDPYWWGSEMLDHYKKLGIDATQKTLLFSDSLDFERARKLNAFFRSRAKVAFGIGTFLANPSDIKLNAVMKVVKCNGGPVAKLSDNPSKGMCEDAEYVKYLRRAIDWRLENEEEA
jgi:nicotinate phosphoribosyltransferase